MHQESLAISAGHGHAQKMRSTGTLLCIDDQTGYGGLEASGQLVAKPAEPLGQGRLLANRKLSGATECHSSGYVLGSGPDAELLTTTMDNGLHRLAIAHDQGAYALWGADLVP
jgi:hypothetical protein